MRRRRAARPPHVRRAVALVLGLVLTGCGGPRDDARAPAAARAAPGLERGALLSLACTACHTLAPGAPHGAGPNLHGVFGRRAGALEDFEYSRALADADFVWTPERLDAWLAAPESYLPGTTMTFSGYQSAADREALIEYLRAATATRPASSAR